MTSEIGSYLPVRPPPQPDESVSSWLVRLAAIYHLKFTSFCGLLIGKEMKFGGDLDATANASELETIATKARLDSVKLRTNHTLAGWEGRLFTRLIPAKGTPWVLPLGSFYHLRPGMQYCPLCLQGPVAYFRRTWRLSLFSVCPHHRVRLHHLCSACRAPTHPIRNHKRAKEGELVYCWNCGFDLRCAAVEGVAEHEADLSCLLWKALDQGAAPPDVPTGLDAASYFAGLAMLCARLMRGKPRLDGWRVAAAEAAGVPALPPPVRQRNYTSFDSLTNPGDRGRVIWTAHWLLQQWPERFLTLARATKNRTSDFSDHYATAPAWFLEPLLNQLNNPKQKFAPSAGMIRAQGWKELVLEHRREWSPTKLPRLVRALRAANFYSEGTCDQIIVGAVTRHIAKLRKEGADYRKRQTMLVPRRTQQWSRLLLLAKSYRKHCCKSPVMLQRGIRLLCSEIFLSSADLAELLHRSHVALMVEHLTPMVRAGRLQTKFGKNRGGSLNYPGQGYRASP